METDCQNLKFGFCIKKFETITNLEYLVNSLEEAKVDFIHLDFLDGKMVNDTGVKATEVRKLRELTSLPIEAHLMEYAPRAMKYYSELGINRVFIHHESNCNKKQALLDAKDCGMKAGIALKPTTQHDNPEIVFPALCDSILVMATKSGSSGKAYDETTSKRIQQIKSIYSGPVEVNSGIATYPEQNIQESTTYKTSKAGATIFSIENGFKVTPMISNALSLNVKAAQLGKEVAKSEATGFRLATLLHGFGSAKATTTNSREKEIIMLASFAEWLIQNAKLNSTNSVALAKEWFDLNMKEY